MQQVHHIPFTSSHYVMSLLSGSRKQIIIPSAYLRADLNPGDMIAVLEDHAIVREKDGDTDPYVVYRTHAPVGIRKFTSARKMNYGNSRITLDVKSVSWPKFLTEELALSDGVYVTDHGYAWSRSPAVVEFDSPEAAWRNQIHSTFGVIVNVSDMSHMVAIGIGVVRGNYGSIIRARGVPA